MALQTENTLWFWVASALEHGLTSGVGCGGTRQKHNSCCRLTEIPLSQNLDNCRGQRCWRNLCSCRDMSSDLSLSLRYTLWKCSLCNHLLLLKNQKFFSSPWFLKIPLAPSSANFSFFFPPLYPPFILSFSFLFPLTKNKGKQLLPLTQTPSGSWTEDYDRFQNDQKMWLCRVMSGGGGEEKNKGAKPMNEGIQWVERQNARLVRFSGYPETRGRTRTERKDRKNTQK